jgi:hypothetical protein
LSGFSQTGGKERDGCNPNAEKQLATNYHMNQTHFLETQLFRNFCFGWVGFWLLKYQDFFPSNSFESSSQILKNIF